MVGTSNLAEGNFLDTLPAGFDDGSTVLLEERGIGGGDDGLCIGRDDDTGELLADMKFAHDTETHQAFAAASFGVAVTKIPGGGLVRRTLGVSGISLTFLTTSWR